MKYVLSYISACLCFVGALAQDNAQLIRGNECFEKKDYACAADAYRQALQLGQHKVEQRYLLEYRIGLCYNNMSQYALAKQYLLSSAQSNPNYAEVWMQAGNAYYNSKNYDSSILCYEKSLTLVTSEADKDILNYWLGRGYLNAKKYSKCIAALQKVNGRSGSHIDTDTHLGEAYYFNAQYRDAYATTLKAYAIIPASNVDDYKANMLVMGRSLNKLGKYDSAIVVIEKALEADPNYYLAFWDLGLVNRNQGKYATSNNNFKRAMPGYVQDTADTRILINNMIQNAISLKNTDLEIALRRQIAPLEAAGIEQYARVAAIEWGIQKQPAAAVATAAQGLKAWKALPDTNKYERNSKAKAKLMAIQGLYLLQQKDTAKAMGQFEQAIKKEYNQFEANLAMGDIAWARKNNDGIKTYYTRLYVSDADTLLSNRQTVARMQARKAHANYFLGGSKLVNYDVEQALAKDSLQKEAIAMYANSLDGAGQLTIQAAKCRQVIDRGIKAYSADKPYTSQLLFKRAIVNDKLKDTLACRKDLEEAVRLDPQNYDAWQTLMTYYQNRQDEAGGEAVANRLIKLLESSKDKKRLAIAYLYKGDFLWRQNKKDAARSAYSQALVWDPENSDAKSRSKMQ